MENKIETSETFVSKDISLISAILSTGKVSIAKIERHPQAVFFHLENKKLCEELSKEYYNDKLIVSARELNNRIREVKDLLFSGGERYV